MYLFGGHFAKNFICGLLLVVCIFLGDIFQKINNYASNNQQQITNNKQQTTNNQQQIYEL
ncbi:MAG TPA: hypothetical protein DCP31_00300 [Cyanobacteria bacterium UBA8543]|nr:hypothetical protein [Cyanobacteria bacterium UBA8543]